MTHKEHEALVEKLNDEGFLHRYKESGDGYHVGFIARLIGGMLIFFGNTLYGKKPSLGKFKAIEVIARIPYQSWEVATYTLLTGFYQNEKRALQLSLRQEFQRIAQDNETMHVIVVSQLVKKYGKQNYFLHTLVPLVFSFFYFWISYLLYLVSRRTSLEINYLFESHAFDQYSAFIKENENKFKETSVHSDFLEHYGREVANEYEFFVSVRNDEIIHRNESLERIREYSD